MSPTGDSSLRVGVFTRINVVLGVLLYSLFPMFAFWTTIRARQMDMSDVSLLLVGIVSLQAMLFVAARRCSSEQLPFWRGVTITAASMRTGWIYLDMLLAGGAVAVLLLMAGCIGFTQNPAHLYHRAVYAFYKNRMEQ